MSRRLRIEFTLFNTGEELLKTKYTKNYKKGENDVVELAHKYYITYNGSHLYISETNEWKSPQCTKKEAEGKWYTEYL